MISKNDEWQPLTCVEGLDPETSDAIKAEFGRQTQTLEMIASENFTSRAVLQAQGSVLTNKYAEGLPGRRYYGGCEHVDVVERLAIERAKKLFSADSANVQPHSGAQANFAVYLAMLKPGDTVLGMNLAHGGHLTHGSPVNVSGKYFNIVAYGVNRETERIDYDDVRAKALEHRPKLIIAGASAYPRQIDFAKFREIADEIGATFMTDMAHIAGLVAAGLHPNPVESAHIVTSTVHKTLRGPRSGFILCKKDFAKAINKAVFPGSQGGPLMHVIAAKAIAFYEALQPEFKTYQKQVIANAQTLGEALVSEGLRLCSGGTDNHLLLVDLTPIGLTGKAAEEALEASGITVNKNMIPFDTRKPMEGSGIRIGTPALTTRGMKEDHMRQIASWIMRILKNIDDEKTREAVKDEVKELVADFPLNAWEK